MKTPQNRNRVQAFLFAAIFLMALLIPGIIHAGTITVVPLPPTNTDLASGITSNKTYVSCFDYGSKDTVTYSVNGVPFQHVKTLANNVYLTTNWIDTTHGGQVIVSVSAANKGVDVTSAAPSGQADGNMNNLFYDQIYPGTGQPANGWMQEEYDNLIIGDQYSLRIYYRYQGGGTGQRLMDVWFNGEGSWQAYSGNPLQLDTGTNGVVLPNGMLCHGANYIEYDFTAAATNAFFLVTNINGGEGSTTFAATVENDSIPYAPFITYEPTASAAGSAFVFNVTAIGTPNLAFQWYVNTVSNTVGATMLTDGNGYSGSTSSNLTYSTNYLDYYFVVVTNNYGAITSTVAQLNPLPVIEAQPTVVKAGQSLEFVMSAGGLPPLSYQWYVNTTTNYSGATALTDGNGYSGSATNTLTVSTNYLDYYFVIVSNTYGAVTSQVVRIATSLTVQSAGEPIWNQAGQSNIIVAFSDTLDPVTSTATANYSLNNGASVTSATLVGTNEVVLATSALTPATSYTLTVQNVEDYYGITMTPTPTNVTVGLYPAKLALWLKANTGTTLDPGANTVNQWNDLSGNNNTLAGIGPPYDPELTTNGAGDTVMMFTGSNETFLYAASSTSLAITGDMSIIAVMDFADLTDGTNGMIVSKTHENIPAPFDYYVTSTNLGARLYRGNGSSYGQFTATQAPTPNTPHIVAVSMGGTNVTHYLDGVAVGSGILNNNFSVTNITDLGDALYIGTREDTSNCLTGDIAELIVAGSAISAYDQTALITYLEQGHNISFVSTSPTNLVLSLSGNQLTLSWPSSYVGWGIQSNSVGLAATNEWFTIPGSTTTNQILITVPTQGNVFYRMFYP